MLDSGFQSPGFRIPQAQNSWFPESGFPYMGRHMEKRQRMLLQLPNLPDILTVKDVFQLHAINLLTSGKETSYLSYFTLTSNMLVTNTLTILDTSI